MDAPPCKILGTNMAFRTNIFTGELEEYDRDVEMAELAQFNAESRERQLKDKVVKDSRFSNAWSTPWVSSRAMRVDPSQVADFNEAAQRNGTGAFYRPDGSCVCESRGARNREMEARGLYDKDGGFGDYTERKDILDDQTLDMLRDRDR